MITSTSNATIRYIQKLQKKRDLRQKDGVFVVEGFRIFKEIPEDRLVRAYISETASGTPEYQAVRGLPHEIVSDAVMEAISDTKTTQGFLGIVRQRVGQEPKPGPEALYLFLDHLQDPGNLGTILRMSEAAGVDGVVMSSDTVDIYNPKVVRATMGAIFRVPFVYVENLPKTIHHMRAQGMAVYGASLQDSRDYALLDYKKATGFVIGNEANGICGEVLEACTGCVHIPMEGAVESLNAAVAASILTFEAYRQKRI